MRRAAGFTLLELLIGLTLLGFILTLLFGGFRLAVNSWDAVESHLDKGSERHAALALLRRLLGSIEPIRQKGLSGQPLMFAGGPDKLVLVASLTGQVGPRVIELAFEPDPDAAAAAQRLVLRDGPLSYITARSVDAGSDARNRTLLGELRDAAFRYFGATRPGEQPGWHESWVSAEELPRLIGIRFVGKDAGATGLVVATTISADRAAQVRITAGPPQ